MNLPPGTTQKHIDDLHPNYKYDLEIKLGGSWEQFSDYEYSDEAFDDARVLMKGFECRIKRSDDLLLWDSLTSIRGI